MAWYQRNKLDLILLKKTFNNIFIFVVSDFKNTLKNIKIIFKNPKYLLLFIPLIIIIQLVIIIIFILIFINIIIYFFSILKNFFIFKNFKFNIINCYKYNYFIDDKIYKNTVYVHFYFYFYHLPRLKAFSLNYNFFKKFNEKTFSLNLILIVTFLVFIIIILPIRFFIKFLTGFNYLCIKVSSNIICDLIHINNNYNYDSYLALIDNLLLEIDSTYYYPILNYSLKKKIYFNDKKLLIFNPWFDKFFTDLDKLTKSFKCVDLLFKIRFAETSKISAHPIFESFFKKYESKELTALFQSSNISRPIASCTGDMKIDNSVVSLDKGVLGKIGVHDYRPVTIDLSKNSVKISNVPYWKISDIELQKKEAFKSLCLGLYKRDLVMEDGKIIEGVSYNNYIDRLFYLHEKKELTPHAYDALSYLLDFAHIQVNNDPIKIIAWDLIFSKLLFLENGDVVLPNLSKSDLPLQILNTLDSMGD